jgi:hypothetical protein
VQFLPRARARWLLWPSRNLDSETRCWAGFWPKRGVVWAFRFIEQAAMAIGKQIRLLKVGTQSPMRLVNGPVGVSCSRRSYDRTGKELPPQERRYWYSGRDARTFVRHPQSSVDARCTCTSACFLIWVGGMGRYGTWIGVHRPFFDAAEYGALSPKEAERRYVGRVMRQLASPLMGIPPISQFSMALRLTSQAQGQSQQCLPRQSPALIAVSCSG